MSDWKLYPKNDIGTLVLHVPVPVSGKHALSLAAASLPDGWEVKDSMKYKAPGWYRVTARQARMDASNG